MANNIEPEQRPGWLTVEEAAAAAGIARRTMEKRLRERKITYHRDGARVLINAADLARYIEARKVPARRPA